MSEEWERFWATGRISDYLRAKSEEYRDAQAAGVRTDCGIDQAGGLTDTRGRQLCKAEMTCRIM